MAYLGEGDLAGLEHFHGAPRELDPTALVAFLANFDLPWVLDDTKQELLLRLTPDSFDGDRGAWAITLAPGVRGDAARFACRRGPQGVRGAAPRRSQ